MCRLQNWCLPHYYPFCFPHKFRSGRLGLPPVLEKMTASKLSSELLKQMVDMYGEFELPKYIILKDGVGNNMTYLSPNVLSPTSEFTFTELSESFLVRKDDTGEDTSEKEINDESLDDALYCHLAPGSIPDSDQITTSSYTDYDQEADFDQNSSIDSEVGGGNGGGSWLNQF